MKEVSATLSASLDVECPYCRYDFDLFYEDADGTFLKPIFNNDWETLIGCECECPKCNQEFILSEVIW